MAKKTTATIPFELSKRLKAYEAIRPLNFIQKDQKLSECFECAKGSLEDLQVLLSVITHHREYRETQAYKDIRKEAIKLGLEMCNGDGNKLEACMKSLRPYAPERLMFFHLLAETTT